MEALTAVAVAALTIYDMVKAVDQSMVIGDIRLMFKSGGRSGTYDANPHERPRQASSARRRSGVMPRRFGRVSSAQNFPSTRFLDAWDRDAIRRQLPAGRRGVHAVHRRPRRVCVGDRDCAGCRVPAVGVGSLMLRRTARERGRSSRARSGIRARSIAEHVIGVTIALGPAAAACDSRPGGAPRGRRTSSKAPNQGVRTLDPAGE